MAYVLSWTESEIDVLVQAWSEVEAKYPSLRCPRGSGKLHAKVYALFSKRSRFARSALAVKHTQQHIRNFVLFVDQFDKDRQKDGERRWYQLSVDEREQRRGLVPRRARGLTTTLGPSAFATLLQMERVQRWLGGGSSEELQGQEQEQTEAASATSSFISPGSAAPVLEYAHAFSPLSGANTPSTEHDTERIEDHFQIPEPHNSDTSTCSLHSKSGDEGSPMSTASTASPSVPSKRVPNAERPGKFKKVKTGMEVQGKLKHRDCNILLENVLELHNTKMRRAVSKLRADIEGEIQRSAEMLLSIISNQFKDPKRSGDVAFVTKVLEMQKQQVRDRFDRLEEKRAKDEAECRVLVGQRFV